MYYKSILRCLMILLCVAYLAACNDEPADSSSSQSSRQQQSSTVERASQQSRRWQQQFEAEHALRIQVETHLSHEEAARSWWQNTATVLAIVAVVLLGVGITLGSAARHESQKP